MERKYAVDDGLALPALTAVPGAVAARTAPAAHLEATYLDTADRALLRARIALRRRTGGHDEGWHVKLPAEGGRLELYAPIDPLDPARLPDELARPLFSRVRGRPLVALAVLRTERRAVVVEDAAGGAVEVVDDRVVASDVAAGTLRAWREWEAEQVGEPGASAALLDRVDVLLRAVGARPSPSPAKLAQALGLDADARPAAPVTAGDALLAALRPLAGALHDGVAALVRDGDPDGTVAHELRKSLRRVRSLLALGPVAGPGGEALRERLRVLGDPLGEARDPIVAASVVEDLLGRIPADSPGLAAARERLVDRPRADLPAATAHAVEHLLSAEAAGAYAAIDDYLERGPDGRLAGHGAGALARAVDRVVARAIRRAGAAGTDLDELHAARRAARWVRFVVEGLAPTGLLRRRVRYERIARRAAALQDALGDHRDLALVRATLADESARWTAAGANAFVLGSLDAAARGRLPRLAARAGRRARSFARSR